MKGKPKTEPQILKGTQEKKAREKTSSESSVLDEFLSTFLRIDALDKNAIDETIKL